MQLSQIIYLAPRLHYVSKFYFKMVTYAHGPNTARNLGRPGQVLPGYAGTEGQGHSPWTYILALCEDSKVFPVQFQLRPQQIFQFLSFPTFCKLVVVKVYHGSVCCMGRGP